MMIRVTTGRRNAFVSIRFGLCARINCITVIIHTYTWRDLFLFNIYSDPSAFIRLYILDYAGAIFFTDFIIFSLYYIDDDNPICEICLLSRDHCANIRSDAARRLLFSIDHLMGHCVNISSGSIQNILLPSFSSRWGWVKSFAEVDYSNS